MPLFIHLESNPQVVWADCGGGRCYEGLVLRCESVRERGSLLLGGSLPLMWERAMPVKGLCSGASPFASVARSYRAGRCPLCGTGHAREGLVPRCGSVRARLAPTGRVTAPYVGTAAPVKSLCSGAGPFASEARSYRWRVKPQRCVSCLYSCGRRNGSCCGSLIRV